MPGFILCQGADPGAGAFFVMVMRGKRLDAFFVVSIMITACGER